MTTKNKTVLVVDDDSDMLKLIERILSAAGFKVITALNPMDGRKILSEEPPHLILTDLEMAPENGFSFIQSVRSQKQYDAIPMLVLSALNDFGSVKKAVALGINDYVIKPLQAPMLLRKIRKALFNKDFVKWEAKDKTLIKVEIEATISAIGETGFALSGPFKLTPASTVELMSKEFSEMGLDQCLKKVTPIPNVYQAGGKFINQVTFVGIGENSAAIIRKFLNSRKA